LFVENNRVWLLLVLDVIAFRWETRREIHACRLESHCANDNTARGGLVYVSARYTKQTSSPRVFKTIIFLKYLVLNKITL